MRLWQVLGYEGMWGTIGVGILGLPLAGLLPGEDIGKILIAEGSYIFKDFYSFSRLCKSKQESFLEEQMSASTEPKSHSKSKNDI